MTEIKGQVNQHAESLPKPIGKVLRDEQTHKYFVNLLQRLPKTPLNEQTPYEREHGHEQFGSNFFMLFSALQSQETDPEAYSVLSIYTARAEKQYSEQWQRFIKNNRRLIDQIYKELDRKKVYLELLEHFRDLLMTKREGGNPNIADEFTAMGIKSVGIYVWRKLNPLLKEAADQMKKEGINPEKFFG